MKAEPIVIERVFDAPSEKVWQAITDKQKMKEWYFDFKEFKAEPGFEFTWYGGDEKKQWLHAGKIKEVVPGKKLSYSWGYPEIGDGESLVTFELFPEGNKTKLRLTHTGLENFPSDEALKRENFVAGWTEIIGTMLKDFLEKENVPAGK